MHKLLILLLIAPLCAGPVLAQTKAPAKARTAELIECSKQADAKGLHGKERRKFRAACKKQLLKKKG